MAATNQMQKHSRKTVIFRMNWITLLLSLIFVQIASGAVWPGNDKVSEYDSKDQFTTNLSGLKYIKAKTDYMWGVRNDPSTMYKFTFDGTHWVNSKDDGWKDGKSLRFPDGTGSPDAEDLIPDDTGAIFVCSEKDTVKKQVSKPSVLRYVDAVNTTTLVATHEWDLTNDLPPVDANLAWEGITWIPDSYLVSQKFFDEHLQVKYDPSKYPGHGNGIFFLALEDNGYVYAYALMENGNYARIATFPTGEIQIMSLVYDEDMGYLWAICDYGCDGRSGVLKIGENGKFNLIAKYDRPTTMPNVNTEGFTMVPESMCKDGMKAVYWADDDNTNGHSLRGDTIPCGQFVPTTAAKLNP